MSISYSQSDSNLNNRSIDVPASQPSEVHGTAGRRSDENQLNAEPADPPSASPSPLRGQIETNQPIPAEEATNLATEAEANKSFEAMIAKRSSAAAIDSARMAAHRAAFDLGWQGYLQRGRLQATTPVTFESMEPELAQLWRLKQAMQPERLPWEEAKETARDAWNQVHDALAGG